MQPVPVCSWVGYCGVEMMLRVIKRVAPPAAVLYAVTIVAAHEGPPQRRPRRGDVASTHAYLTATYAVLHAAVSTWPTVGIEHSQARPSTPRRMPERGGRLAARTRESAEAQL